MTQALPRAIAVDLRALDTGDVTGVALVVPTTRVLSYLATGAHAVSHQRPSDETWRQIEAAVDATEATLPFKPQPFPPAVVDAILGGPSAAPVTARRFASIPIGAPWTSGPPADLDRVIHGLLARRRAIA